MANRHGIHSRPLAILSTAAQHIIFQEDHHMPSSTETLDPVTLQAYAPRQVVTKRVQPARMSINARLDQPSPLSHP
ncbi:MAG: hypothetical protein ACRDRX_28410 [Pseudonocardiaceae bacterium]